MNKDVLKSKELVVNEVSDLISSSGVCVVCEYRGLTVKEISELRKTLKTTDGHANVYKNSLVSRATKEKVEGFDSYLTGPNLFVFCKDAADGSLKALAKFTKRYDNLTIKAGIVDGKVADDKYIKTLASLPSKEGLLGMLLSVLQAPMRNLAYSVSQIASNK